MLSAEELEHLARYRAGDLSPDERRALEARLSSDAQLRASLARLAALDDAARALPTELPATQVESLIQAALPPAVPAARAPWLVSAALLVALLGTVAWSLRAPAAVTHAVAVAGPVTVDGHQLFAGDEVARPAAVRAGAGGSLILSRGGATWLVPAETELLVAEPAKLSRGAVVVRGVSELDVGGTRVAVDGVAVVAMEPSGEISRVTRQLEVMQPEDLMKSKWLELGGVGAAMAALGSAVTVVVMSGTATATDPGVPAVTVRAGESWRPGTSPARLAVTAAALPPALVADVGPAGSGVAQVKPEYAAFSREQLVAMAESLRDEKEKLLTERAALKKKLADAENPQPQARNYYRFDPEELAEAAKKGELRLRGPQLGEHPAKLTPKMRDATGLNDSEAKAVEDIFNASTRRSRERLVALYKEIGGDPRSADTLSSQSLLSEIRDKALTGEFAAAVRQLANERAGLVPPGDPNAGSAILRALRIFVSEDAWVLDELDRLLGPRRAESFLNGDVPKSDSSFGVGPAPRP